MEFDLAFIWAILIAVAVLAYVLLDGFDLGVGILFPVFPNQKHRETMMNSIAPFWDGNETWLILGGGGLFAVFPLAYSLLLTAFYAPLMIMLAALIFRGVAFEFRYKSAAHKPYWDMAFIAGSFLAAFTQGVMLGAFIQGIAVDGRSYTGGWFDWLTPFSIFTGLAVPLGYALLGATWLYMKTEGTLQARTGSFILPLLAGVMLACGLVSLWTPLAQPDIAARWFSWPNILLLSPVPIGLLGVAVGIYVSLHLKNDVWPFLMTLLLFVLAYAGFGITVYPHIVPPSVDIWQAAGPDKSLGFLLAGTVVLLPMVIGYTAYAYWVFRGKVKDDEGYHA